jgi:hypothetical protein
MEYTRPSNKETNSRSLRQVTVRRSSITDRLLISASNESYSDIDGRFCYFCNRYSNEAEDGGHT